MFAIGIEDYRQRTPQEAEQSTPPDNLVQGPFRDFRNLWPMSRPLPVDQAGKGVGQNGGGPVIDQMGAFIVVKSEDNDQRIEDVGGHHQRRNLYDRSDLMRTQARSNIAIRVEPE